MRIRWLTVTLAAAALIVAIPPPASAGGPAPIAFTRDGDLFTYRLGGTVHRLTETPAREHTPAWAPGHGRLAFMTWQRRIGVVDLGTGTRRSIARLPDRFDCNQALAWSPDGTRIAVAANNWFEWRGYWRLSGTVWIVGADGSGLTRIVTGQGMVTGLGWTPDGRRLFASTEWPNGVELWNPDAKLGVITFKDDGSHVRFVSETLASQLDVADDGTHIAYRGWSRTCHACGEIWRMATDGTDVRVIAMPPEGIYGLHLPRFSPEGTRIAMLASARRSSMWLMRPDGSHRHRVLTNVGAIDW